MATPAAPTLDAARDPATARRMAAVGRATRWALAAAVGLALLGFFGGAGPLARTEAASGGGLRVGYDRFARLDAPATLAVNLPPGATSVTLTGDLADGLQVEAYAPTPVSAATRTGAAVYGVDGPRLTVYARPLRFGVLRGRVEAGREAVALRMIVYP